MVGLGQRMSSGEKEEQVPTQITSMYAHESQPISGSCHMPDDESQCKRAKKWGGWGGEMVQLLSYLCYLVEICCLGYF